MPFIKVYAKPCDYCKRDVASPLPGPFGWSLICHPEHEGCGAQSVPAKTLALAIDTWNGNENDQR